MVEAAISSMEMPEVLVRRTASSSANSSIFWNVDCLKSRRSGTASMMNLAPASSA